MNTISLASDIEKIQEPESSLPEEWTKVIEPPTGWFDIKLKQLWQYRDLIKLFVYRDFVVYYKQTILGPLWWIIQPLFMSGMFTLIFGTIAKISTDKIPPALFYLSGVIMWSYFADCITNTSRTFIDNANIFGKVYFPRLVIPVSIVISGLFRLLIQFCLFTLIYLIFIFKGVPVKVTLVILALPLLVLQIAILGLGFGIIISSLTTKYKDLNLAVGFFVQLWMYATPVVYPLSILSEKWRMVYMINPMTSVIECFRLSVLGTGTVSGELVIISVILTIMVLVAGIVLFSKVREEFYGYGVVFIY